MNGGNSCCQNTCCVNSIMQKHSVAVKIQVVSTLYDKSSNLTLFRASLNPLDL